MKNPIIVFAAACVAAVIAFLWYESLSGDGEVVAQPSGLERPESAEDLGTELQAPSIGYRQAESLEEELEPELSVAESASEPARDTAVKVTEAEPSAEIRGRVFGLDGLPIAGLRVVLEGTDQPAEISAADGSFALAAKPSTLQNMFSGGRSKVITKESEWVTVLAGNVLHDQLDAELLVVAAKRIDCAGHVTDRSGQPLEGALLSVSIGDEYFSSIPIPLDHSRAVYPQARSAADGSFRFEAMPQLPQARLQTSLEGFERDSRALDGKGRLDQEIVLLEEHVNEQTSIAGVVVYPDGSAAAGATVRLANATTQTDAAGAFRLEYNFVNDDAALVAVEEGRVPAHLPRFGALLRESGGQIGMQRLVLGDEPLSISGRVLDAEGEPVKWMKVALHDPTAVSQYSLPPTTLESMVRGGSQSSQSNRDGSFEIGGLLRRDYSVRAWDAKTLLQIISEPVPAGTDDLELRIPADALHDRIAGVVRSRRGLPLADVQVSIALVTSRSDSGSSWITGKSVVTDELGHFEIEGVPAKHVHLNLRGDGILNASFEIDEWGDNLKSMSLEVSERCRFRVEGADSKWTRLEVLDAAGAQMMVTTFKSQGSSSSTNATITGGGTHVLAVGEDARTVVFHGEDGEVHRVSVRFSPAEIEILTF